MIAYPVRKQLEGRRVMRGPRAQVVLFEMHEVGDQVPSVVFVDPPQHVCCRFERSLGQESLNFASPKIGLPSKQGVLVEALPAPPTTWESRTQTRTDHVPKASLLHQMDRAGLADAADWKHDVKADAGHERRPLPPPSSPAASSLAPVAAVPPPLLSTHLAKPGRSRLTSAPSAPPPPPTFAPLPPSPPPNRE